MKQLYLVWLMIITAPVYSAEVFVLGGTDTLQTAVANASDGDTLILYDEAYVGSTLTINKSLVIRAIARNAVTYIGMAVVIEGEGIEVSLQGLTFDNHVYPRQAQSVSILENRFLGGKSIDAGNYKRTEGDGALYIIGNKLEAEADILNIASDEAYIAGNTIVKGRIYANDAGGIWVVGNNITGRDSEHTLHVRGVGEARIIGNRVTKYKQTIVASAYSGSHIAIYAAYPVALISGNIVLLSSDNGTWQSAGMRGIYASNLGTITNNVVHWSGGTMAGMSNFTAIYSKNGRISGNIVSGFPSYGYVADFALIENNICFDVPVSCPSIDDGNLTADPNFIDTNDFKLATGSPAIDGGASSLFYADLDRSRNDMGAYGGPWNIEQYDKQRDTTYIGPFVYPLFKANASINDGFMRIQALGVARLR